MCWKLPYYRAIAEEDITTYKTVWQIGEDEYCALMEWGFERNGLAKKGKYRAKYPYRIGMEVIMPDFTSNEEEYAKIAHHSGPKGQYSSSRRGGIYFGIEEHKIAECIIPKGIIYYYCDFENRGGTERIYCSERLYYKSIVNLCVKEEIEELEAV